MPWIKDLPLLNHHQLDRCISVESVGWHTSPCANVCAGAPGQLEAHSPARCIVVSSRATCHAANQETSSQLTSHAALLVSRIAAPLSMAPVLVAGVDACPCESHAPPIEPPPEMDMFRAASTAPCIERGAGRDVRQWIDIASLRSFLRPGQRCGTIYGGIAPPQSTRL